MANSSQRIIVIDVIINIVNIVILQPIIDFNLNIMFIFDRDSDTFIINFLNSYSIIFIVIKVFKCSISCYFMFEFYFTIKNDCCLQLIKETNYFTFLQFEI